MKKQSVFNPIASLLAAMCCVFAGSALAGSDGTWEWTESGSEATLVRYAGSAANVTIPATLGGKTVVAVADGAFDGKTQVTALTIPASVTSVGTSALVGCTALKSVTMPQCMCSGRASSFFKGFYQKIEHVTVQPGATTIGKAAFLYWSGLKTIDIPEGVTSIGETAFKMSGLESVRIPASVKQIDQGAFLSCYSLKSIGFFCAGATVARETFLNDEPDVVEVGNLSDFCRCSFAAFGSPMGNAKRLIVGGQEMADITIPSDIRALTKYSFRDALCLSSVTLPATVSSVEEYALANCTSMKSVIFQGNPPSAANFSFRYTGSAVRNEKSKGYFLSPNYAAWRAKVDANANYCRLPIRCLDSANLPFKIAGDGVGRTYAFGDVVTLKAPGEIKNYELEVTCTGWTGTGNIPASGTGNSVTITVLENSSIEWHYTTNVLHLVTSGGVPYQWIADNFPTAKESQFEALMAQDADKDGLTNGEEYFAETNPNNKNSRKWRVTFDVGANGTAAAGSRLVQYASQPSGAVTPPAITPKDGWLFAGWTGGDVSAITADTTLTARYRTLKADLHVDSITVPETAKSGDILTIAWTVGNTGNPDWTSRTTQKVWLRNKADPSKEIVVSRTAWTCSIPRDGSQSFSVSWLVPAKHIAGEWEVLVETALDTGDEFGGVNSMTATHTLTITEIPLPDLSVSDITLAPGSNLMPGDEVTVGFTVNNTGAGAAKAPWVDTVYLVKGGQRIKLGDVSVTADLAAKSSVKRELKVTIPELVAVSGEVTFFAKADSGDAILEEADDDAAEDVSLLATPNATLGRRLYLSASTDSVSENYSGTVRYTVSRSGEINETLPLSIAASGATGSVSVPASATLGVNARSVVFRVSPVDNALVDGTRSVTLTVSAAGVSPVSHVLTILDNEVPKLFVTLDRTSVREGGDAIKVTVRRELVTDEPLTVYLNGPSSAQCVYPTSVIIPAGEESVTFDVAAKDDAIAEIDSRVTLTASASGYTSAATSYTVEDDDVPGVTLTITPEEIAENGGAKAAYAVLARTDTTKVSNAVTVRLTPSVPGQLIMQNEVVIPKGYLSASIYIGAVDNSIVDGDRDIEINGSIVIESCGCAGQPSSGDAIQAVVRIIDDDVPKLTLTSVPVTMREGLDHAGDLVLSHNSMLDEDLEVTLSWDLDGEICIPTSVIIPAGQSSVTIPVKTIDDGVTDGGQQVSVYADDPTGVFASGSTWIQVSDQNLPDLSVENLTYPNTLIGKEPFEASFRIVNAGFAATAKDIGYEVHIVSGRSNSTYGNTTRVASGTIRGGLAIGGGTNVAVTLTTPEMPGDYRLAVVVDTANAVVELEEADNTTWGSTFSVSAAYSATVTAERKVYLPGESVNISGTAKMADGSVAANVPVDVYVLVEGMRRTVPGVVTDENGAFAAVFDPLEGEAGRYQIGACYPNVGSAVQQDYFDILGMKRTTTSTIKWDMSLGDVLTYNVSIRNRSGTALTGLDLAVGDHSTSCEIEKSCPVTLPANGAITIRLTITAAELSGDSYEKIPFTLTSAEGVTLSFNGYFHCQSQKPQLRITSGNVSTTMSVGQTRYIDVTLRNDGKGDTGKVTVDVPTADWLKIVSGSTVDNLACGETAVITLALSPTEEDNLPYNSPIPGGRLTAACANGNGTSISLTFTPVSEEKGSLTVDAVDNNTYAQPDQPHLAGATVKLINPYTGAVLRTGKTGSDGLCTFSDVAEGIYTVSLTAANHDSVSVSDLEVSPGRDTRKTVFMKYQLITASWEVVPTEIEDQYEVKLVMNYDTSVPSPVLQIDMPEELPDLEEGGSYAFNISVYNKGLIAAEKVTIMLPDIPDHAFTLAANDFSLAPGETMTVPCKFERPKKVMKLMAASTSEGIVVTRTVTRCIYTTTFREIHPCGDDHPEYFYKVPIRHGDCSTYKITEIIIPGDDEIPDQGDHEEKDPTWVPVGPSGPGGTGKLKPLEGVRVIDRGCYGNSPEENCLDALLGDLKDAILGKIPGVGDLNDGLGTAKSIFDFGDFMMNDCAKRTVPDGELGSLAANDRNLGELARDSYDNPKDNTKVDQTGYQRLTQAQTEAMLKNDPRFTVSDGLITTRSGLKARLYVKEGGDPTKDEVVLAYAGTDSAKDLLVDTQGATCNDTQQYKEAANLADVVSDALAPNQKCTFVGHSLGGGEASYAKMHLASKGKDVSNIAVRTYNAMGLCADQMHDIDSCEKGSEDTINYRTANDPISAVGFHNGKVVTLAGWEYSGHGADNFGVDGPKERSKWMKGLTWLGFGTGLLVDWIQAGWDEVGGLLKYGAIVSVGSDVISLYDCIMANSDTQKAMLERFATETTEPAEQNAAPARLMAAAPTRLTAAAPGRTKLEELCDALAEGNLPPDFFSPDEDKTRLAIKRFILLDVLQAAQAVLVAKGLGGTDAGTVADMTQLAYKAKNGWDAGLPSIHYQAPANGLLQAGEPEEMVVPQPSVVAEMASRIVACQDDGEFDMTLENCRIRFKPDGMSDSFFDRIYEQTMHRIELAEAEDFETLAEEDEEANYCMRIIHTIWKIIFRTGTSSANLYYIDSVENFRNILQEQANAVCASVQLSLSQNISLTREAFTGTLTMFNGNTATPITALKMNLSITDEEGNERKDRFAVEEVEMTGGMGGTWILNGGTTIAPGEAGSAVMRFIPKPAAAPSVPKVYSFGGTLVYKDPFTGNEATMTLVPVLLTVNPSPFLHLDYFVQRDVFADDPFTPDVVEASMPAEIAVLVRNEGAGDARNVTIQTPHPQGVEIVENEKSLKVAFDLKDYTSAGSALNGANKSLSLTTANLGTIAAGSSSVAQWWLNSTLQGHFTDLAATVTALNSWNTADTALIDLEHVGTHELVRSIEAKGQKLPAFLTTSTDSIGIPDAVYLADGTADEVYYTESVRLTSGSLLGQEPVIAVSLTAGDIGWNYGYLRQAGLSRYEIVSVTRKDGSAVSLRNVWITNRTFPDGLPPIVEDRLHIVDDFASVKTETYTISLKAKPADPPAVEEFLDPVDGIREYAVRDSVTVRFSKEIAPDSFTADDIVLWAGNRRIWDLSALRIAQVGESATDYSVSGLSAYCAEYTSYQLTVQAAGITDLSGIPGEEGKSVTWILSRRDAPYVGSVEGIPESRFAKAPVDGLIVTFTGVIDPDSLLTNAVALNGIDLEDLVTFTPLDESSTRFRLTGLAAQQTADGDYALEFNDSIRDIYGIALASTAPETWTLDTTAPTFVSLSTETDMNNRRSFTAVFSEPIDPESLSGCPYAAYASFSGSTITFRGLDDLYIAEGSHTFTLDASAFADRAGNAVSGTTSRSVSWTKDTVAPAPASGLAITPDLGMSAVDGITATGEIVLSGTVAEPNLTLSVFLNEATVPLMTLDLGARLSFEIPLKLQGAGAQTLSVRLTDAAGNESKAAAFSVFVDNEALLATLSGAPEVGDPAQTLALEFSDAPDADEALAATLSLTLGGQPVAIPNVMVTKTDDTHFLVSGLAEYTAAYGDYVFTYAATEVTKRRSGLAAERDASISWTNAKIDRTAPSIADVTFGGAAPAAEYVDMFSRIDVTFSEDVNVPELIEKGLAPAVFAIRLLDDGGRVVGVVNAQSVTWNEVRYIATCLFDPEAVPVGSAQFVVDAALIADPSGNRLSNGGYRTAPGTAAFEADGKGAYATVAAYAAPTLYDFNGDGLLDLVVGEKSDATTGKARVFVNSGSQDGVSFSDSGSFTDAEGVAVAYPASGCQGLHVSFGDVNGDGRDETVIGLSDGKTYVWRYLGGGPTATRTPVLWRSGVEPGFASGRSVTICRDLDGDGRAEIVSGGSDGRFIVLSRAPGRQETDMAYLNGTDGEPLQIAAGRSTPAFADVNGDGVEDLVSGDTSGNVWAFIAVDGGFAPAPVCLFANDGGSDRSRVAAGDLDGDGVGELYVGRTDGTVTRLVANSAQSPAVAFRRLPRLTVEDALGTDLFWPDADGWTAEQTGMDVKAKAKVITDNGTVVLTTHVSGRGRVDFNWSVSGYGTDSTFVCLVDGVTALTKVGAFEAEKGSVELTTAGDHVVVWRMTGKNTAEIDSVVFTPADPASQYTETTEVPVPFEAVRRLAPTIWKANAGDYEAAAKAVGANGLTVMDSYVAGLEPENPDSKFRAVIEYEDGEPKIGWQPDLSSEGRTYRTFGKATLDAAEWTPVTDQNKADFRFFRVTVEMSK